MFFIHIKLPETSAAQITPTYKIINQLKFSKNNINQLNATVPPPEEKMLLITIRYLLR